jgi:hypothetical protein
MRPFTNLLLCCALTGAACAQTAARNPRLGYVFPAGARAGATVEVIAGGQNLRGARSARASLPGVEVAVVKHFRAIRNLTREQRRELMWRVQSRRAELDGRGPLPAPPDLLDMRREANRDPAREPPPISLPDHPLLDRLARADRRELEHLLATSLPDGRRQPNPQLGELVSLRVTVADGAGSEPCEIRLVGPAGLTNPLAFQIGRTAEEREWEPNDPGPRARQSAAGMPPQQPATALPVTFNGQILPGDVDRFRFTARRGQQLVLRAHARGLIPYLADAVPGWFQMVMAVRDSDGRELAWVDDFRFSPDPVLQFVAPRDGEYELEVRDALYRGREDFVYRIEVGELPFITAHFPLGAATGTPASVRLDGWNLPADTRALDTDPGAAPLRHLALTDGRLQSNRIAYHVDDLPAVAEIEPNDTFPSAQAIAPPGIIDGRIAAPGDTDIYRLDGSAGQQVVAEVTARRLGSPLDSLVRLSDVTGEVLAWNDDRMDKDGHLHLGEGLLTHHADSYLHATLPRDGPWFVSVTDARGHGSSAHAYRLRISAPRPDFELRVTPSAVAVAPGGHAPIEVFALRSDGFDGGIDLALTDAPPGFRLSGARIPPGCKRLRLTLAAPAAAAPTPVRLVLRGRARAGARTLDHPATPADDTMQAFLWRHLVPAGEWLAWVGPARARRPPLAIAGDLPVRIPAGGAATVTVRVPKWLVDRGVEFQPSMPPAGLTVSAPRQVPAGFAFDLAADATTLPAGSAENLLVEGLAAGRATGRSPQPQRASVGFLPAIPFVVDP